MARTATSSTATIEAPIRKKPGPKPGSKRKITTIVNTTREAAAAPKAPRPGASAKPTAVNKPAGGGKKTMGGGKAMKGGKGGKGC